MMNFKNYFLYFVNRFVNKYAIIILKNSKLQRGFINEEKMIIIIILILIFFIIGIIIGNHLLKEDEFVTNTITNTINDSSSNDNLLEYFSTNISNGTEIGNNECIYGMVTSINDNIIQISDIYRLRGGTGFQCEEYTSAFINIQDISSFIDYETLEDVNNNYDIIGNVIICHGKLVQNNNINFMMANKGEISVLDDMFFYNTLYEIINNKKEISNVEKEFAISSEFNNKVALDHGIHHMDRVANNLYNLLKEYN